MGRYPVAPDDEIDGFGQTLQRRPGMQSRNEQKRNDPATDSHGNPRQAAPKAAHIFAFREWLRQSHSGCHCTPAANALLSRTRTASMIPSGARASMIRLPARRSIPCSWTLFTVTVFIASILPNRCLLQAEPRGNGKTPFNAPVFRGKWFSLPGSPGTSWCRVPPRATLSSWIPRQIHNMGMPASITFGIRDRVVASRCGVLYGIFRRGFTLVAMRLNIGTRAGEYNTVYAVQHTIVVHGFSDRRKNPGQGVGRVDNGITVKHYKQRQPAGYP